MKLYHVTHRDNLPSILANGLDPSLAKNRRKSVWGVVRSRAAWAIVHVLAKPWNAEARISDLVVIEVSLPKSEVRRYKTGVWYTVEGRGPVAVTHEMVRPASHFGKVS